ncbi:hypothetical protein TIFTF001_024595 [Ficus carica]|uniref:Uncharacterized protein n=1 Tax=Ficus carica TaxID=3494 RepID=A0AA88DG57_FICCA|nr:hypothetical protein TIFTF001_024595 [Ficus carica]
MNEGNAVLFTARSLIQHRPFHSSVTSFPPQFQVAAANGLVQTPIMAPAGRLRSPAPSGCLKLGLGRSFRSWSSHLCWTADSRYRHVAEIKLEAVLVVSFPVLGVE